MNYGAAPRKSFWLARSRVDSSFGGAPDGCPHPYQEQYLRRAAAVAVEAPRSTIDTARTLSQSSYGSGSWREPSVGGGGGGEMEGGSSGSRRREIWTNLALSDFARISFLAQGAMCKCFLATGCPRFRAPVVLKMSIENGPRGAERDLNRELSLLHNLSHPNLTMLLGAGLTPKGKTFMAIEYLDGGTLRARMDSARGGLGFWPAVRHATELASVMRYLHDEAIPGMCILHRDLKPDNLGFRGNVMKLFDLGLAKVIRRSDPGVNDFYRMSGEVGSLRYMSPEVASKLPYNEKVDVHSFALVMWELVTGWLPYAGLSPEQFMFQAVQHGHRPLMQFGWDARFKSLLESCWAEDPKERPGFSQIHDTLTTLLAERGTPAIEDGIGSVSSSGCCAFAASSTSSSSTSRPKTRGVLSRLMSGRWKSKMDPPAGGGGAKSNR